MTKRHTHPENGLESTAPKRPPRDGEQAPARPTSATSNQGAETEERTPQDLPDSSTRKDRGASDALMESYNG